MPFLQHFCLQADLTNLVMCHSVLVLIHVCLDHKQCCVNVEQGESGGGDGSGALAELEEAAQAVEQLSEQPYTLIQVLQALVHLDDNPR